jgi:phosphoenolpyruvate carboxykinase (GTP)
MARDEGWLAEHMLILKLTSPEGAVKHIAGAFPSACGKTNLAMLVPTLEDWTVETVGDDIAWMKVGEDGRLFAVNPEAGFFGVAPNTSATTNPNAVDTIRRDTVFTNCAKTDDGDIWWEGLTGETPEHLIDWKGNDWTPDAEQPAAHPNARFTVAAARCPSMSETGGSVRRADRRLPARRPPLDRRPAGARGVRLQARRLPGRQSSEKTAAAAGKVGELRFDPFAMLPFCGYNMADYFAHWVKLGERKDVQLPRVFHVNWFRKDADGKFPWPGYGENSRVLAWIFRRCDDEAEAIETPIGLVPAPGAGDRRAGPQARPGARGRPRRGAPSSSRPRSTWRSSAPTSRPRSASSSGACRRAGGLNHRTHRHGEMI